jgi:hypothetical protein
MKISLRIREYVVGVAMTVFVMMATACTIHYDFTIYDGIYYGITSIVALVLLTELLNLVKPAVLGELAALGVLPAAFVLSSIFNNAVNMRCDFLHYQIHYWTLFISLWVICMWLIRGSDVLGLRQLGAFLWRHKWIFPVLAIACAARIPYMDVLPRWDSGEYYARLMKGIHWFSYESITDYVNHFTLCGHPTLGFCFVYIIGEVMFPGQVIGVSLVTMVLTLLALLCCYSIMLRMFPYTGPFRAAVYTLAMSFLPLVYGTFGYFNPDYALAMFFVLALWGYVYEKPLITGLGCLLCVHTKETGLVLVAGLVLGIFVEHILEGKGIHKLLDIIRDLKLWCMLVAVLSYLFYTNAVGGLTGWTQSSDESAGITWDNDGYNCLGIQWQHIITKLKQHFVLNFNWIFVCIIVVGLLILFARFVYKTVRRLQKREFKLKSKVEGRNVYKFCGFIFALMAFVAFSCLYITAAMARYNVSGDLLLAMLGFGMLDQIITHWSGMIAGAGVGAMLAMECFFTVDPLTLASFKNIHNGATNMVHVGRPDTSSYYGDYLIYNTQYTYIDKAMDSLLAACMYDENFDIILFNDYGGIQIAGNEPLYSYEWDKVRQKRGFNSNANTVTMSYVLGDLMTADDELKDYAIAVFTPYHEVDMDNAMRILEGIYHVGPRQVVYESQGGIYYYPLVLKEVYEAQQGIKQ